jgi:hypothetical protein
MHSLSAWNLGTRLVPATGETTIPVASVAAAHSPVLLSRRRFWPSPIHGEDRLTSGPWSESPRNLAVRGLMGHSGGADRLAAAAGRHLLSRLHGELPLLLPADFLRRSSTTALPGWNISN